jgi:PKHD-type hydroxylase
MDFNMNNMIAIWPAQLKQEWIDSVSSIASEMPVQHAGIGVNGEGNPEGIRKSEVRWINPYIQTVWFIKETLMNFARDANRDHWGFDIDYVKDIQYTTYKSEDNGKYDWHEDTFWINSTQYHRKVSIVVQLSDAHEYTGGEFQIDPQFGTLDQNVIKQKGTVIAFPSFLRHRVTPLLTGTRTSLVSWVEGPKFR